MRGQRVVLVASWKKITAGNVHGTVMMKAVQIQEHL